MEKARNTSGDIKSNYSLIQILQDQIDYAQSNFVIVNSREDLPSGSVIQLEDYKTYIFANPDMDLNGVGFVCGINNTIIGPSSENSSITSTGLVGPLITSNHTTVIRHITIKNVDTALYFDGEGNTMALDWTGVNFENVPNIGVIKNFGNFIFNKGAFLNSKELVFDGTMNTVSFTDSLLSGDGLAGDIIRLPSTAVVNRRFRITYSAFIVNDLTTGLNIDVNATIPDETYILDTVNFSGNGTYLSGIDYTYNKASFVNCFPITNTSVTGQVYMRDNATPTPIAVAGTFYKVLGSTLDSADNSKVITGDNYIEIDASIQRKYRIDCTLSFDSVNNNVCSFAFYDSFLGEIRQPSIQKATANASGRAENITLFCFANRKQLDYFEVHCTNNTLNNAITVTDMNFSVTELK